ncbi:MAG: adenylate/guanylate cyclase domain-containing protein [Deltaproteobacteria bacterium]|nr:adenylate/guanylate cyclase domain-containing protein [Deltaproteobacteria bacterium]
MNTDNLRHRLEPLRESGRFDAALLERLHRFVAESSDEALFRVNPVSFARDQKISERDAIDLFVHATRAGLFDFAWGLLCPICGSFITTPGGLRHLSQDRVCGMCGVEAGETLDDGVEVTFTINPAVRPIRFHGTWVGQAAGEGLLDDALRIYFSHAVDLGSEITDFFRRSAVTMAIIPRTTSQVLRLDLDPNRRGEWRLIAPSLHAVAVVELDPEAPSKADVQIDDGRMIPETLKLKPGPVELTISQRTDASELILGVLCLDYESLGEPQPREFDLAHVPFLTGKRLLSTQSFRELFRTETLPPDGSLEIRALAMLFTDLKASTQLYERVGDLKALALVREHFQLLRDVVAKNEGAVVKTIGDAVMATFTDPVKATAAAVEMHEALEKVPELQLKVGLHVGPCVAIDSNERLDYFGQTVNIAARVQALAEGREVVITDHVLKSPGVAEIMKAASLPLAREEARLKGIDQPVIVHRTTIT